MTRDQSFNVISFAETFGVFTREPLERLEAAGCSVSIVKHDHPLSNHEMAQRAIEADAIVLGSCGIAPSVMAELPRLKLIVQHGRGIDGIDYTTAAKLGITITNAPGTNVEETADLTFGLIIDLARHISQMNSDLKNGIWEKRAGHSLYGKTIGIIGVGDIGTAVARRAMGFGMDILGNDIYERESAATTGLIFTSLNSLLRRSDIVTLHVPLTASTTNLIGAKELNMMRKDAILINTSRAGIIREKALEKALSSGKLYGFATDVYKRMPCPMPHIASLPNVLVTPHAGSATYETNLRMGMAVADNIIAFKNGNVPPNKVTPMSVLYG